MNEICLHGGLSDCWALQCVDGIELFQHKVSQKLFDYKVTVGKI
jgi:hypothetical protein